MNSFFSAFRNPSHPSRLATALLVGCVSLAESPSTALADSKTSAVALDQFEPTPPADSFITVPSVADVGWVKPAFGVLLSFAHDPLVVANKATHDTESVVVSDQLVLHLGAAIGLFHRVLFDVDAPFTLHETGDGSSTAYPSPSGATVGDLRLGLRGLFLEQNKAWPGAAATFQLWTPTGNDTAYTGAGITRFAPGLSLGAEFTHWLWGASLAVRFQPKDTASIAGSQVRIGLAGAGKISVFQLGAEVALSSLTDTTAADFSNATTDLEILAVARASAGPVRFTLAGGPDIGRAPGTPTFRVLAGAAIAFDAVKAPSPPGGVIKSSGADPTGGVNGAGAQTTPPPKPVLKPRPDRDQDGIPDEEDMCPEEPGVISENPAKNGCPLDSDGDGIPDKSDACIHEPGPADPDPKKNGCPASVHIQGTQIVITNQVHFQTGSAIIDSTSFGLLTEIAKVINANPSIARVAIDGHTDNQGNSNANLLLSRQRAVAVAAWLTEHGVDARRTEARGFGDHAPIADNKTESGRATNRRVEFTILRKSDDGERGWRDGTLSKAPSDSAAPSQPKPPAK